MKRHSSDEQQPSVSTESSKGFPVFALLSILCPFLGVGLGILMFKLGSSASDNSGAKLIGAIVVPVIVVVAGGSACAIASFRKREGHPIAALIGLILSVGPCAALLFGVISKRLQE